MAKLSGKKLAAWEKTRDLNAELLQAVRDMKRGKWARKTEFIPQRNGSIRRIVTRRDGTVEKDHLIPAGDTSVRAARAEPENLAFEASERYGYPAGFLARYFEKLRYRFGPRERAGLYTFLELARDVGELDAVPELRFVHEEVAV